MFSPPEMMISFFLSSRYRKPSSSSFPMSPVWNQPLRSASAVAPGFFQYPYQDLWATKHNLTKFSGRHVPVLVIHDTHSKLQHRLTYRTHFAHHPVFGQESVAGNSFCEPVCVSKPGIRKHLAELLNQRQGHLLAAIDYEPYARHIIVAERWVLEKNIDHGWSQPQVGHFLSLDRFQNHGGIKATQDDQRASNVEGAGSGQVHPAHV